MKATCKDITAITAVCNTKDYIERMYNAFRECHPDMKLIILDNSDTGNPCQDYLNGIASDIELYRFSWNVGHAKALNFGMKKVTTKHALIMDSDTKILKDPVPEMYELLEPYKYGVGWITEIGRDGYDFGTFKTQHEPIKYLHPYFCLINVEQFYRYQPFTHHGNPFVRTMIQLHDLMLSHKLVSFPGLTGHSNGKGANWIGTPSEYVQHDFGGTRMVLKEQGRQEIEGKWEY